MTEIVLLFIAVISIFFAGFNVLRLLSPRGMILNLAEELAFAFGLGAGFISLEMFAFYFIGLSFNVPAIMAPWVIVFLWNVIKKRYSNQKCAREVHFGKICLLDLFFSCGVAFEVAYAFFRALIKPMEAYDAVAIYAIKSKIFYLARSIPAEYFTTMAAIFPHPDYPLNIPLIESFIYLFLGQVNGLLVKVIFPIYFAGMLTVAYFAIRRFSSRTSALLAAFLIASVPQVGIYAANGYIDMVLAFYVFAAFTNLLSWFEDTRQRPYLLISAVMAGLAGWTKNEGMMYAVICAVLLLAFLIFGSKEPRAARGRSFLLYCVIVCAILAPWAWLKHSHHIVNADIGLAGIGAPDRAHLWTRIWPILYEFQKEFFNPKKWNILWPLISLAVALNLKRAFSGTRLYAAAFLFLAIGGYVFTYISSPLDAAYFVSKTWSRFLLHFLPVAVYWAFASATEETKP